MKRKEDKSQNPIHGISESAGRTIRKIKNPALGIRERLLLYTMCIVFIVLSLGNVMCLLLPEIAGYAVYALAALTLSASCYYLTLDIRYGLREKIRPGLRANPFTGRLVRDYRYRTVVFAVPGLMLNMVFALFNGAVGVINRSAWFGTLSAYYLLLSVMRFSAVRYDRQVSKMEQTRELMLDEITVYRKCGILFVVMTIALGGAVVLLAHAEGGKQYPGYTIFAVAAYTFYKIIVSALNMIKAGKLKSPLLMSIRDIGYIDACVSILSLQTAMFSAFGEGQEGLAGKMNGAVGSVVCVMTLLMGIRSIRSAGKMKKEIGRQCG